MDIKQLEELKNWANNEKECAHYGISFSKLFIVAIATTVIATQLVDFLKSYSGIEIGFNPEFFSAIICIALFMLVFLGVIIGYIFFSIKANDARLVENYYSDIVQIIKYVKKKKILELRKNKRKNHNKTKN